MPALKKSSEGGRTHFSLAHERLADERMKKPTETDQSKRNENLFCYFRAERGGIQWRSTVAYVG